MLEPPILTWFHREWRLPPIMRTESYSPVPSYGREGWFVENANPRPLVIQSLRVTARYRRWLGGHGERSYELRDIRLQPGQESQVRPPRLPWFSSLSSHTLSITATYGQVRYRLDNYRSVDLFAPGRSLTLRFYERDLG